jgi:hypothetical protein
MSPYLRVTNKHRARSWRLTSCDLRVASLRREAERNNSAISLLVKNV